MPLFSSRSPLSTSLCPAVLAALVASAAGLGGCDRQTAGSAQPQAELSAPFNGTLDIANRGSRLPAFVLADPSGKRLSSADLAARPVLINLWATWCGPCVLEMPMLDQLASDSGTRLRVVTVSQDIQGADKVKGFFAKRKFAHLEPWLDPENTLSQHYGTGILPTSVLYDAEGREVWRMIGGHDWSSPRTTAMLADTVGRRPGGGGSGAARRVASDNPVR